MDFQEIWPLGPTIGVTVLIGIVVLFVIRGVVLWYFDINKIVRKLETLEDILWQVTPKEERENMWRCSECTHGNHNSKEVCERCNHTRGKDEGSQENEFKCPVCEHENPENALKCESCGYRFEVI